jgi:hypothetical protein
MRNGPGVAVALVFVYSLILTGCSTEMPDGLSARGDTGLFPYPISYPDTVEVFVFGMVSEGSVSFQSADPVQREWLSKHDYVHIRTEFDSLGTETIQSAEEEADASLTEGETIAGNRVYVRVE